MTPSDVASFRLVNKRLCSVGDDFLLREVCFFGHRKSVRKLLEISQHPVFATKVRTLVYESVKMASERDMKVGAAGSRHPYAAARKEFEQYLCSAVMLDTVIDAVEDFQRLKRVEIIQGFRMRRPRAEPATSAATIVHAVNLDRLREQIWRYRGTRGLFPAASLINYDSSSPEDDYNKTVFARRFVKAGLQKVGDLALHVDSPGALFWGLNIPNDETLLNRFRDKVTTLDLRVAFVDIQPLFSKTDSSAPSFGMPLQQLTHLSNFSMEDKYFNQSLTLFPLGSEPEHLWPNLRKISFRSCSMRGEDLMDLVQRHQETLKSLHFEDFALYGRLTWPALLSQIKGMGALKLNSFTVSGLLASPDIATTMNASGTLVQGNVWAITRSADMLHARMKQHIDVKPDRARAGIWVRGPALYQERPAQTAPYVRPEHVTSYAVSPEVQTPPLNKDNAWYGSWFVC